MSTYLHARNTDTDMCGLNHADIVGSITNSQKDCLLVFLDELDDKGFLER